MRREVVTVEEVDGKVSSSSSIKAELVTPRVEADDANDDDDTSERDEETAYEAIGR